jgi:hypothetical protein
MKDHDFDGDKGLAKGFLENFADANGRSKYMEILQEVSNRKIRAIQVDLDDLFNVSFFLFLSNVVSVLDVAIVEATHLF